VKVRWSPTGHASPVIFLLLSYFTGQSPDNHQTITGHPAESGTNDQSPVDVNQTGRVRPESDRTTRGSVKYTKFLTQLDDLIARIDLTMETTRLPFKRKIVHFAEHNKIFLIPPRETPPILTIPNFDVQNLQSLFPNLFY